MYAATNPADAALFGNDLLGPHRVHVTDTTGAPFEATFHGVLIRDVTLGYLDYSRSVRIEAHALPDDVMVLMPATGMSKAVTAEVEVEMSPVMAVIPRPGGPMVLDCPADSAHLVIRIARDAFDTHLSRLLGRTLDRRIEFEPGFDLSSVRSSRWNFALQMLHAEIYEPESLMHDTVGLGSIEEFLMSALLYCQQSNFSPQLSGSKPPVSAAVRESIAYIDGRLGETITVHDVAEASNVSVRTLQNLFAKDMDQSPTSWIKNRRLERVRSDLADADPNTDVTVTDIATRWGFTHLGRFAVTYKNRFGESPSRTLRT